MARRVKERFLDLKECRIFAPFFKARLLIGCRFLPLIQAKSNDQRNTTGSLGMLIARPGSVQSVSRACGPCMRFNSTAPSLQSSRIYCQNLLQKHDYPSYLQIPFIPPSARDAHLAIQALNVEMALIPDIVSNQYARVMRMQFWKDVVENCFQGKPKAEPVSIILAQVLSNGTRLTKSFFQTIISERVWSSLVR